MPITSSESGVKAGTVAFFAANSTPPGWLKANGAAVSRTNYAALFLAIGTTYGAGNGSTTFNLPDCRGEFLRCLDDGRGVDAGRAIGSAQLHAMQRIQGSFQHGQGAGNSGMINGNGVTGAFKKGTQFNSFPQTILGTAWGIEIDSALVTNTADETRPRNVAMLACIKF